VAPASFSACSKRTARNKTAGPPERIHIPHRIGDFDPTIGTDLLAIRFLGKIASSASAGIGLFGAGMQRRRQRFGKIGQTDYTNSWEYPTG